MTLAEVLVVVAAALLIVALLVRQDWTVRGELQGWRFRLETVPGGVRVVASAGGGEPAAWVVPSLPKTASSPR